ncbi:unnamed protein product [Didymodactylos carnosus]|uniref:Uncharacterized protein n=1 Tax=Didymodactylos carnosus TaxID=1234261 RepID=A0A814AH66_9BILA|nr:unnamed protein product [Didymodactylos carnosus]CAF3695516.1 unnamed protein product [Didymodactylos carnosus]
MRGSSHEKARAELGWVPFFIKQEKEDVFPPIPIKYDFFAIHRLCLFYKTLKDVTDLHSLIPPPTQTTIMTLRSHNTQQVTTLRRGSEYLQQTFILSSSKLWNGLSNVIKESKNYATFKCKMKQPYFTKLKLPPVIDRMTESDFLRCGLNDKDKTPIKVQPTPPGVYVTVDSRVFYIFLALKTI